MSGFGSAVGFVFLFLVLIVTFGGIYYSYNTQLQDQLDIMESFQKETKENKNFAYEIDSVYYNSGRLYMIINNTGNGDLKMKDDGVVCWSVFVENIFFEKENLNMNIFRHISNDYFILETGGQAVFSFKYELSEGENLSLKVLSCSGIEKFFNFEYDVSGEWSYNWESKKIINVYNMASESMWDYQVELELNSSNFDFENVDRADLRFVTSLKNFFVADVTFDLESQILDDYSNFSNIVIMGSSIMADSNDPSFIQDGVVFGGLNFDGVDDYVNITSNDVNLLLNNTFSFSGWIKWDGGGDNYQSIVEFSEVGNKISIINDGGFNDGKLNFSLSINGLLYEVISNKSIDRNWIYITAVYDGGEMELYMNSEKVGNQSVFGSIDTGENRVSLGSNLAFLENFKGSIDEVRMSNVAFEIGEINELYYNNFIFRVLDYYVLFWDESSQKAIVFVKIPNIVANSSFKMSMYYDADSNVNSLSDIESVFSYNVPRKVGYIVNDRTASQGISVLSLYDDNKIIVGSNDFELDEQISDTNFFPVSESDAVLMKYLAQVEGQGDGVETYVPISWAGTEFYYSGFRNGNDRFCMLSPWGTANVEIFDAGVSEYTGIVDSSGDCVTNDIADSGVTRNLRFLSDIPILVSYHGAGGDSFVMYPATNQDLYGVPSNSLYVANGDENAAITFFRSDGTDDSYSIGNYEYLTEGGIGGDGDALAFKIVSDVPIGAIQQADTDGSESSVFAPLKEMGVKFGSADPIDYVVFASPYANANCSIFNSAGGLVENIPIGDGTNGVYRYGFNVPSETPYLAGDWMVECDKPVWGYYELDEGATNDGDESNMVGHLQMRQYIYPEPLVSFIN